jgi:hypothetical protein
MIEESKPQCCPWRAVLVLASLLAFSSAGLVQKYFGLVGLAVNLLVAAALVGWIACWGRRWATIFEKRFVIWMGLAAVVLAVGYGVAHPFEDGKGPGKSSDRDEGLEIAVTRMVSGQTPYYPENQVAGPLSVLPGAIMLAVPFVMAGDVGYQNVFWLVMFMLAAASWYRDKTRALLMAVVLMAASPSVLHEFVSGGDLIANGLYVALAIGGCLVAWSRTKWPEADDATGTPWAGWKWLASVFLGVAMASRPNFLLLYPLLAGALWRLAGLRVAATAVGVAGLVSVGLILPFYLHDPDGFTPWIARKKMAVADHLLPWAGAVMIGTTALLSAGGAWWLLRGQRVPSLATLMRWCAVVTVCPMVCAVAARSWVAGGVDFGFMLDRFGVMYLGFAVLGWGGLRKAEGLGGWSSESTLNIEH